MSPTPSASAGAPLLRAVLIGLGGPGEDWLAALASSEAEAMSVQLVGLGDLDPERAPVAPAEVDRAQPMPGDLRQVLGLEPDLVADAEGPGTRLAIARAALLAGAHVLCEPPLAADVEAATALLSAARGRLAVVRRTRRLPGARQRRDLATSRALGRALTPRAEIREDRRHDGEGVVPAVLRGPALQAFDTARMILGSEGITMRCVERSSGDRQAHASGAEAYALLERSCGALFVLVANLREAGPSTPPPGPWRLVFEEGAAEWAGDGHARAWRAVDGPPQACPLARLAGKGAGLLACLAEAVVALREPGHSSRRVAARDGVGSLAISFAAQRSARAGGRLEAVRPLDLMAVPAWMAGGGSAAQETS